MKDCIFCKIIKDEIPSKKIYEDDIVKVIMNINPEQNGDLLILLKRHAENFTKLTDEENVHINKILKSFICTFSFIRKQKFNQNIFLLKDSDCLMVLL